MAGCKVRSPSSPTTGKRSRSAPRAFRGPTTFSRRDALGEKRASAAACVRTEEPASTCGSQRIQQHPAARSRFAHGSRSNYHKRWCWRWSFRAVATKQGSSAQNKPLLFPPWDCALFSVPRRCVHEQNRLSWGGGIPHLVHTCCRLGVLYIPRFRFQTAGYLLAPTFTPVRLNI